MSRRFLSTLVIVAGVCTLGLEMTSLTLLAPYFGISQLVWATAVGVTLLYLTIGYVVGGRLADRRPSMELLCSLLCVAGLFIVLIPLLARPILHWTMVHFTALALAGALLGMLGLFALPMILLAMTSPFAVRLALRQLDDAGRTAGTLFALSTVGSLVGTFLPPLLLTPLIGTTRTIYVLAIPLLAVCATGLWQRKGVFLALAAAGLIAAVVGLLLPRGSIKASAGVSSFEVESFYNYILVTKVPDREGPGESVDLGLNEGWVTHSIYHSKFERTHDPRDLLTHGYWDFINVAPFVQPHRLPSSIRSLAMIGLGAGTVPKMFLSFYGAESTVDGVEIDGKIVDVARAFFGLEDRDPRFPHYRTYIQDGRWFLNTTDRRYDIVAVDVYRWPYIPSHLVTREFFQTARRHLNDHGVLVVKCDRGIIGQHIAATLRSVFPQVFQLSSILIAVPAPVGDGVANFEANARAVEDPTLRQIMDTALKTRSTPYPFVEWNGHADVFTDDLTPVEYLLHKQLLKKVARGAWLGT